MHNNLMPSQAEVYEQMDNTSKQVLRRKNMLLLGKPQTGKSFILKKYALDKGYTYINFTEELLKLFLTGKRLANVSYADFEMLLRNEIAGKDTPGVVIIDEVDSVISVVTKGETHRLHLFYKQFLNMDLPDKYIMASSIYGGETIDYLSDNRVMELNYLVKDKQFIIEKYLNNVCLMEMKDIFNLRQLIKPGRETKC